MVTCSNPSQWVFLGEEDDTGGPVDGVIPASANWQPAQPCRVFSQQPVLREPCLLCRWTLLGHCTSSTCDSVSHVNSPGESQCCWTPHSPPVTGSLWKQCTCWLLTPFWPHRDGGTDHDIINQSGQIPPAPARVTRAKETRMLCSVLA